MGNVIASVVFMGAPPFSFEASEMAGAVEAEKFIRPDLSRIEILC